MAKWKSRAQLLLSLPWGLDATVVDDWKPITDLSGLSPGKVYQVRFSDGSVADGEWHPFWKCWMDPLTDEVFDLVPVGWREKE